MRLLTESQKGILQGDIESIGLSSKAQLYLVCGLPHVFQRVFIGNDGSINNPWLYIPLGQLLSIRHSLMVESSSPARTCISHTPIEIEESKFYPILMRGEICGIVVVGRLDSFEPDEKMTDALLEAIAVRTNAHLSDRDITAEFVRQLFDGYRNPDEFLKAILCLLIEQGPDIYGAVYRESDGIYKMRMAAGDISLSDCLDASVDLNTARDWIDTIRREEFFLPAEILPDYPCLLEQAPRFLFVHPSIRFHRTEYLIAIVMTGEIDSRTVAKIRQVTHLASCLHESQFSTAEEAFSLYKHLGTAPEELPTLDEILLEVFDIFRDRFQISRIVFVVGSEPARVVIDNNHRGHLLRKDKIGPIPEQALKSISHNKSKLYPDVQNAFKEATETEQYRLDNVCSEIHIPVKLSGRTISVLAVGSSELGDHLHTCQTTLSIVAQFLSVYVSLYSAKIGFSDNQQTACDSIDVISKSQRFSSFAKLAGGHFHDMLGLLAVIIGQMEIIQDKVHGDGGISATDEVLDGTKKIIQAADETARRLGHIRDFYLAGEDNLESKISYPRIPDGLSVLFEGYSRQIKDTRNLSISIQTKPTTGDCFPLTRNDLHNILVPLIVSLMEVAVCSGNITINMVRDATGESLVIRFPRAMIDSMKPVELLEQIFQEGVSTTNRAEEGMMRVHPFMIEYGTQSNATYRFTIRRQTELASKLDEIDQILSHTGVR